MTLGQRLKWFRMDSGRSPQDVAEALGVSRATVYAWETDSQKPNLDMLEQAAGLYKVELAELFSRPTPADVDRLVAAESERIRALFAPKAEPATEAA